MIFSLLIALVFGASPENFLWKKRVIIVEDKKQIAKQLSIFKGSMSGFKERKLTIIHYPKNIYKRDKDYALLGLDGRVKAQSDTPFEKDFLFQLIDSMPMRQSEINSQNKN